MKTNIENLNALLSPFCLTAKIRTPGEFESTDHCTTLKIDGIYSGKPSGVNYRCSDDLIENHTQKLAAIISEDFNAAMLRIAGK